MNTIKIWVFNALYTLKLAFKFCANRLYYWRRKKRIVGELQEAIFRSEMEAKGFSKPYIDALIKDFKNGKQI